MTTTQLMDAGHTVAWGFYPDAEVRAFHEALRDDWRDKTTALVFVDFLVERHGLSRNRALYYVACRRKDARRLDQFKRAVALLDDPGPDGDEARFRVRKELNVELLGFVGIDVVQSPYGPRYYRPTPATHDPVRYVLREPGQSDRTRPVIRFTPVERRISVGVLWVLRYADPRKKGGS